MYDAFVSARFPSPAADYIEGRIGLNRDLIKHLIATFYIKVIGDSMRDARIDEPESAHLGRLPSRTDSRVHIISTQEITHFYAEDKLTFARTADGRSHHVDFMVAELERCLDPHRFVGIYRASLFNLDYVAEVPAWFSGCVIVRLKSAARTELQLAQDRVRVINRVLGM